MTRATKIHETGRTSSQIADCISRLPEMRKMKIITLEKSNPKVHNKFIEDLKLGTTINYAYKEAMGYFNKTRELNKDFVS